MHDVRAADPETDAEKQAEFERNLAAAKARVKRPCGGCGKKAVKKPPENKAMALTEDKANVGGNNTE